MPFLIAAVVLVGAIAILNLLLTMAVIRRLRRNEANTSMPMHESGPAAGSEIPSFSATTVTGEELNETAFGEQTGLVAFFSTTCSACKPAVSTLVEHIEKTGMKPDQVMAVISGEGDERAAFTEALAGKASVVTESEMGSLTASFSIAAFPSFVHLSGGVVDRSHSGVGNLAEAV